MNTKNQRHGYQHRIGIQNILSPSSFLFSTVYARYSIILLLNFLLIYTGFGIFMGAITVSLLGLHCVHLLRDRRWNMLILASIALAVALLSIYLFLIDYKYLPASDCFQFPHQKPWEYIWFIGLMLANMVGLKQSNVPVLAVLVGSGLFLAVIGIFVYHAWKVIIRSNQIGTTHLVITILLGYSLLYSLNAAVGRVCIGMWVAQSSRYITLLIPAFLGLYFHFLTLGSKKLRISVLALYAVLIMHGTLFLQPHDRSQIVNFSSGKQRWKACYLETKSIEYCDSLTGFVIYPLGIDGLDRQELQSRLDYLEQYQFNLFAREAFMHPGVG